MNFRNLTGLVLSTTLLIALTSCSRGDDKRSITPNEILANAKSTQSQKAEQLAKAAEQLLSMQGFAYADEVADLALQTDSSNVRAQFVKAILGPIMVQEGMAQRLKPLAAKEAKTNEKYNEALTELETKMPNSTLKTFAKNGAEDIRDEKDVQNYLDKLADSFKALREFAKKNKNAELTVMTTDMFKDSIAERYDKDCGVTKSGDEYKFRCSLPVDALEVKMNRADFETIQMAAAGLELYASVGNSYNLTGAADKAVSLKDQSKIDAKAVIEDMLKNKEFATLRTGNGLARIKNMGHEAVAGLRWIAQNQKTLCPQGEGNAQNRPGMLFFRGLCDQRTEAESLKGLAETEEGLNGKTYEVNIRNNKNNIYKTHTRLAALSTSPIADLRSIVPTSYDKCGHALTIANQSLSGLIATQDANNILAHLADCNK